MNEQILTGKKYRVLADESTGLWNRISFWNKASDTEMEDGQTVEQCITTLNDNLTNINVYVSEDGKLHYVDKDGADTALPFNKEPQYITTTKSVPATATWFSITSFDFSDVLKEIIGIVSVQFTIGDTGSTGFCGNVYLSDDKLKVLTNGRGATIGASTLTCTVVGYPIE